MKNQKNFELYTQLSSNENTKHSSNPENILASAKNFLKKLTTKADTSKTTISEVLSKNSERKKISKQQYNFCETKRFAEEVHGIEWEAKFLRERIFQGNNTTFGS